MYYCFLPLMIDALDLSEGIMSSLEDSKWGLLWEGLWEGCLGRQHDRGLGHPKGTQRRRDGTQKEEVMGLLCLLTQKLQSLA